MPDREKVMGWLNAVSTNPSWWDAYYSPSDTKACAEAALALLKEQDAVVAHWDDDTGHWIEGDRNGIDPHTRTTGEMIDTFRCSWCGFYQYWKTPFCPNCGAKMEGL